MKDYLSLNASTAPNGVLPFELFYTDSDPDGSDKPALVFIHGFPHTHFFWKDQVHAFSKNYRVVTFDLRGHGKSGPGPSPVTIEFFVDDLFSLLEQLSISKAHICGLSMGGYIALRAIERDAKRFQSLILAHTSSLPDKNEAKVKRSKAISQLASEGITGFLHGFLDGMFPPDFAKQEPDRFAAFREMVLQNSPAVLMQDLLAMAARTDTTPALEGIRVPVLIVVGEKDTVTPPDLGEGMHEKIPGSKLVTIKGAGHLSPYQKPESFNEALSTFLAEMKKN